MAKQAVVKDGEVLVVDTEKGTYEKATPKSEGFVSGLVNGIMGGTLGAIGAVVDAPFKAMSGSDKKR